MNSVGKSTISCDATFKAQSSPESICRILSLTANNDMLIALTDNTLIRKYNLLTQADQGQCTEKQHFEVEPCEDTECLGIPAII